MAKDLFVVDLFCENDGAFLIRSRAVEILRAPSTGNDASVSSMPETTLRDSVPIERSRLHADETRGWN